MWVPTLEPSLGCKGGRSFSFSDFWFSITYYQLPNYQFLLLRLPSCLSGRR